jgi:heme-binding protein
MRRLKQSVLALVAAFVVAQLIRPNRTNPPVDPARALPAHLSSLAAVVGRSCGDCHSNATVWPWYTQVAPVSWLMARGVSEGRSVVNFSEWGAYSPNQQRTLLAASCDSASSGRMPGPWTLLHPETKLSPNDIEIICAAARQVNKEEP